MLHVNDLTYRIEGRPILSGATCAIPSGHKVGLVGRNGAGKTTLFKLIIGDLAPDDGSITIQRGLKVGHVAQEAPGGSETLIEWVLSQDKERAALLAEAETATDPNRIAAIHERLGDIDAHSAPSRAAQILSGLGFDEVAQARACREFSGGWRMRVALGAILFLEPDILLLDEPTNYLDLEGTLWLETYLRTYPHTVVIISHDRDLLNRAVNHILHLDRGKLTLYAGGYDDFEEARREKQRLESKLAKRQEEERARIEAFIIRFKAKASKATQAQSRIKALARMKPIAAQVDESVVPIRLPAPQKLLASPLLKIEDAAVGYEADTPILTRLNLNVDQDDRIALLGQNGNGKSTFAKLLAGRLQPMSGQMLGAQRVSVGYFAQHQLDDLNPNWSPYDQIAALMPDATEAQKRTRLGTWGFSHDKADTKAANLSGGEKARLMLALTAFHAPHLLILDEPTNHLDIDSREALVQALNDFPGAVILISHDRHLIEACVDRLWLVKDGTVRSFEGDLDAYRADLLAERGQRARAQREESAAAGQPKTARVDQRREAAARRAETAPLRRAVQAAEKELERLTAKRDEIDAALADPRAYEDAGKAQKLSIARADVVRRMAVAEEAWLAASAELEVAEVGAS
ncbi:MAG TPA: ABC-F family ATP-binding cassette domain-containing protein [Hyphomicrobiaceae bacterium]|nr:ABC-F family ATP-binding cassette domain-containing protein [Hyphomicrobiaceae bacterium]